MICILSDTVMFKKFFLSAGLSCIMCFREIFSTPIIILLLELDNLSGCENIIQIVKCTNIIGIMDMISR